jgi:glyoxylase-like metal-dependent hydrolase (beta-lactamase superfamily II)
VLRDLFWPVMQEYDYRPAWGDIRATGFYGTGFRPGFPPEGVRFFTDDDRPLPGFETLPTPGHRPEHTAFWHPRRRILICGDCLLRLDGRVLTKNFLSSPADQVRSLARIRCLGLIDHLCPGHGRCAPWDPRTRA